MVFSEDGMPFVRNEIRSVERTDGHSCLQIYIRFRRYTWQQKSVVLLSQRWQMPGERNNGLISVLGRSDHTVSAAFLQRGSIIAEGNRHRPQAKSEGT